MRAVNVSLIRPWNPRGFHYYQKDILRTKVLHTLHIATPLLGVGYTSESISDEFASFNF